MRLQNATRVVLLALTLTTGIGVATLATPTAAHAYTVNDLLSMGYGVVYSRIDDTCHHWKIGYGNGPKTDLGSDCDPGFQARLDAFVQATCPCARPTTTTSTTTPTTTTTVTVTTPTVTQTVAQTVTYAAAPDNDPPDNDPAPPDPPHAAFSIDARGLTVTVADTSGAASVTWSFGDGANGAGTTASHEYTEAGDYTIIETVIDTHGLASQTAQTVTVTRPMPRARLMGG